VEEISLISFRKKRGRGRIKFNEDYEWRAAATLMSFFTHKLHASVLRALSLRKRMRQQLFAFDSFFCEFTVSSGSVLKFAKSIGRA
jgi:hypothetical protein